MRSLISRIPRNVRILIGCLLTGFGVYAFTPDNAFNSWYMTLSEDGFLRWSLPYVVIVGIFLVALPMTIADIIGIIKEARQKNASDTDTAKPEDDGKATIQYQSTKSLSGNTIIGIAVFAIICIMMLIGFTMAVVDGFEESGPAVLFVLIIPLGFIGGGVGLWLFWTKRKVVVEGETVTAYYVFKKPYTFSLKDVVSIPVYVHPNQMMNSEEAIPGLKFQLVTKDWTEVNINGGSEVYFQTLEILEREVPHVCPWLLDGSATKYVPTPENPPAAKYCAACAAELKPEGRFCEHCGAPVTQIDQELPQSENPPLYSPVDQDHEYLAANTLDRTNVDAGSFKYIVGTTLGVFSILCMTMIGLGAVFAIIGLIVLASARKEAKAAGALNVVKKIKTGTKTCVAGLILAPVGLVICGMIVSA